MPQTIKYKTFLAPTADKYGLRRSKPSEAILVSDNKSSDFSTKKIIQEHDLSLSRKIHSITKLRNETQVEANTIHLLATDIYDEANNPLFFKVKLKIKIFNDIVINGISHKVFDNNFIYTSEDHGEITYLNADGNIILISDDEFYPCFIWEGLNHLQDLIDIDRRSFSYSVSNGNIILVYSKPGMDVQAISGSIFDIVEKEKYLYTLEPFIYKESKNILGKKVTFEYDYSRIYPNLKTVLSESVQATNGFKLVLRNGNIIKKSIKIKIIDRKTRQEVYSIDNTSGFELNNINEIKGIIDISAFIDSGNIEHQDNIFKVEYIYMDVKSAFVDLYNKKNSISGNRVFFSLTPTSITMDQSVLEYAPKITYVVADQNGHIFESNNTLVHLNEYQVPVGIGFGEEGFSEHGWGGTVVLDDDHIYDVNQDFKEKKGFDEQDFGEGPFGGSFIIDIDDVKDLIDTRQVSLSGQLKIAEVNFIPETIDAKIYQVNKIAIPKSDVPFRNLESYSGSVWQVSINNNHDDITVAAGISIYKSIAGLEINGGLINEDINFLYYSFDISNFSTAMDSAGIFNTSNLMVDVDAIQKMNLYSSSIPNSEINKDNFKLYNKNTLSEVVGVSYTMSSDLREINVSVPISNKGLITIGIGVNDSMPISWLKT